MKVQDIINWIAIIKQIIYRLQVKLQLLTYQETLNVNPLYSKLVRA